jgi:hypothetical protein
MPNRALIPVNNLQHNSHARAGMRVMLKLQYDICRVCCVLLAYPCYSR